MLSLSGYLRLCEFPNGFDSAEYLDSSIIRGRNLSCASFQVLFRKLSSLDLMCPLEFLPGTVLIALSTLHSLNY